MNESFVDKLARFVHRRMWLMKLLRVHSGPSGHFYNQCWCQKGKKVDK